jgi:hypothetical protein
VAQYRKTIVALPALDRIAESGKPETAHLSCVTIPDWPGILSAAHVVFRQERSTNIYPDDFTDDLVHDLITPTSQKAIDAQHELAFTPMSIAELRRRVQKFYARRPIPIQALSA